MRPVLASALLLLSACGTETAILLRIEADDLVVRGLQAVRLEVDGGEPFEITRDAALEGTTVSLRPGDDIAEDARITIVLSASVQYETDPESSVVHRAHARFVEGEDRDACLVLEQACIGVLCDEGTTCVPSAGATTSDPCVPLEDAPATCDLCPDDGFDGTLTWKGFDAECVTWEGVGCNITPLPRGGACTTGKPCRLDGEPQLCGEAAILGDCGCD